jgi:hypothetical protein
MGARSQVLSHIVLDNVYNCNNPRREVIISLVNIVPWLFIDRLRLDKSQCHQMWPHVYGKDVEVSEDIYVKHPMCHDAKLPA